MGSVNVNRNVTDAFYRYKMPKIQAKVEGKGNGIKTVIVNMIDVAKAIGRPPTYPTKYFGCELGAQTQFDFKNDRYIVNGSHNAAKLQDLLDGFIKKFVLCPECENPETELLVSAKKGTISQGCKACGFHGLLECNHKLNTYILKNPPNINPATQGSSLTEGKRNKRSKRTSNGDISMNQSVQSNGGDAPRSNSPKNGDENDIEVISEPIIEKEESKENISWAVDLSEEAVRQRLQDLTDGAKGLTLTDDLEKPEKERLDMFYDLVKLRRDAGQLDPAATHKELFGEADRLDIKSKAILVLAELLFTQNISQEVKKYRNLFLRFLHDDTKAQRYLLRGIEQVISLHKDALLPKVPGILKLLYDYDYLEEKVLISWSEKVNKKHVPLELSQEIHAKAEPFIKWLKEAEEESDENSEESDLEIEYDDRAKTTPLKPVVQSTPAKTAAAGNEEEDEDFDIDAI